MVSEERRAVILFDGVCHLCNGFVVFVLRRDAKSRFRFAPLQSDEGRRLLESHGVPQQGIDSIVLLETGKWSIESAAVLNIFRRLSWPWPLLYGLILVPGFIRDPVYHWVARNRYRWFGKSETCMIPKPEWRERFL